MAGARRVQGRRLFAHQGICALNVKDLMEKSQRAYFLFEGDHDHEEAPLSGRHAEEANKATCCANCGLAPPPRDSSRRSPTQEAKPRRTSSLASSFSKLCS
ncbi:unnamed protein product [Miscanthus lutarioriparius]|uniref:Uncharacterized protein n=1 Tax=Miscanthus lutarioriparius TaxID=422564 RepID=A0A811QSZ2_9POAL|nr:unnamed protein product [Miscanthus lutarioriparius]